jgi:hypothetical protein
LGYLNGGAGMQKKNPPLRHNISRIVAMVPDGQSATKPAMGFGQPRLNGDYQIREKN